MEKKIITFGKFEMSTTLINALLLKLLLGKPALLASIAGSAGWWAVLVSGVIFLLFFLLVRGLYNKFEGMDIIAISQQLGGNILKNTVIVLFVVSFIANAAFCLNATSETIIKISHFGMNKAIIVILLSLAGIITAYCGAESVVRIHALVVPVILFAILLMIVFTANSFDAKNIMPFFGINIRGTMSSVVYVISWFSDFAYIFLLYPYVKRKNTFNRGGAYAIIFFVISASAITAAYMLTTPYPFSAVMQMPVYRISRLISFGVNTQGAEAFFFPVWILSSMLYLSLSIFFVSDLINKMTKNRYERLPIVPVAMVVIAVSSLLGGGLNLNLEVCRWAVFFAVIIVPFLILLISSVKPQKLLLLLLIIGIGILFCGCEYSKEINEMAYVVAVGADKGEEKALKISCQFAVPLKIASGDEEKSGGEGSSTIISAEADTFEEAYTLISYKISKIANLAHTKVVVFGEELAKEGITDVVNTLSGKNEIRVNTYVCISDTSADEYLEGQRSMLEVNPAKFYTLMFSKDSKNLTRGTTMRELYFAVNGQGKAASLPRVGSSGIKGIGILSGGRLINLIEGQRVIFFNEILYKSKIGVKIKNDGTAVVELRIKAENNQYGYYMINSLLNDLKEDVFGFGEHAKACFKTYDEFVGFGWYDKYKNGKITFFIIME